MKSLNRQMGTKGAETKGKIDAINLEVVRTGVFSGRTVSAGEVLQVPKLEAKRMMALHKGLFKIKID